MIDIQGHRFARGLFPENTLEGLDAACRLGLSSFEIDIAITADGVPVIHHDPALNPDTTRGPDGNWLEKTGPLINHLTFADLASLDVGRLNPGSTYAGRYASQRPYDGARIPTLEALLAHRSAIRLNIELKLFPAHPDWTVSPEEMVDRVLHAVDAANAADRVTLQSFDWRAPRYVRRIRPDIPRGWLTEADIDRLDDIPDAIAAEGGGTWTPHHASLTEARLARAHALNLRVIPWTVNETVDMSRLIGWGVDGLITDRPDRALALTATPPR